MCVCMCVCNSYHSLCVCEGMIALFFMRAVVDTSEDEDPIVDLIVRLPTISDSVTSVLAPYF